MRRQLNLMLGLADDASPGEMKKRYQSLMAALFALDERDTRYEDRLRKARERLSWTYEAYKKNAKISYPENCDESFLESIKSPPPKIGELLVEAGLITPQQLANALAVQEVGRPRVPIGRLLVHWQLISWEQLAFFLKVQDLLKLSPVDKERISRQLVDLGLLTRDEVEQAEMDCKTVGCTFQHAIIKRGWVKEPLLNTLSTAAGSAN